MHLDVLDLRQFYYRTRLGRAAQKVVRDRVRALWPDAKGQTVVGFGFAVPLLRPFLETAERVIGLMPGQQGVMPWPAGMQNVSVLCEETHWPIQTESADRIVVMHGLETSEQPYALLDEVYRALHPGGRALFIVPNRSGLWARRDATPFGFGRPYTRSQLEKQLREVGLLPERAGTMLYAPPRTSNFWLGVSEWCERMGTRTPFLRTGGVIYVEVSKQVPAPMRPGLAERMRRPLRVLEPAMPGVKPVGRVKSRACSRQQCL